jgi:hypothetical protein
LLILGTRELLYERGAPSLPSGSAIGTMTELVREKSDAAQTGNVQTEIARTNMAQTGGRPG